jgi:hypothetical protein
MSNIILNNISFRIEIEELLRKLHVNDEETSRDVKALLDKVHKIGRPKGMYKESFIDTKGDDYVVVDGIKLKSRVLRVNLEDTYRVFPYIATCGTELENWSNSIDDMLQRYWADTIKEIVLRTALETLKSHLIERFKLEKISAMNPGSLENWPINEQKNLFSMFGDVKNAIGVELTESFLMIPTKSVSGIWFPTQVNFENCQLCSREGCPGRRAEYDEKLYQAIYRR